MVQLLLLLGAVAAEAQVEAASVRLDGMSCPFCAFGVEKRLRRVAGVGSVEIHMDLGLAVLTAADGASIDLARIPEAIRKAGFTPGDVEASAVGILRVDASGASSLNWGDDGTSLGLLVSEQLRQRARELAAAAAPVRARGILRTAPGGGIAVEVTERWSRCWTSSSISRRRPAGEDVPSPARAT
jgi:mercuric ion binding protein